MLTAKVIAGHELGSEIWKVLVEVDQGNGRK
jgi:hypothetical protein